MVYNYNPLSFHTFPSLSSSVFWHIARALGVSSNLDLGAGQRGDAPRPHGGYGGVQIKGAT